MSWLASFCIGLLTAIIGAFGTGGLGLLCVDWYRIPGREGGSAYFVLFLGLLGSVFGMVTGVVCARIAAAFTPDSFLKGLGLAASSSIGLLAIATLICWLAADQDTTLHGNAVMLRAEIRCPAGFIFPTAAKAENWYANIDTRSRHSTSLSQLRLNEARQEDGCWIIPMALVLKTSARVKFLYVHLAEITELFVPIFPSKPDSRFLTWSKWQDSAWAADKPRPAPADRFNLRFRVEIIPHEKPVSVLLAEPSANEILAKQELEDAASLATLTPNSPLDVCLKFTCYNQASERQQIAGAIIGRRPNLVTEMSAEILSADRAISDRALRSLACIKPLPAELAGPVEVVGEKVIAGIEHFNSSKPADDPHYEGAADTSLLFSGWVQGLIALHRSGGIDGLTQLRKVLELSQQREDSYVMKNDVAPVARYFVNEWSTGSKRAN